LLSILVLIFGPRAHGLICIKTIKIKYF